MTHKEKDFSEGGFYIWDRDNNEHSVSTLISPGDVLFFDGSLNHEIKPIKGNKGRYGLFEIPTYIKRKTYGSTYTTMVKENHL